MEEELILAVPSTCQLFATSHLPDRKYPAVDVVMLSEQKFVMLTEGQFMQRQLQALLVEKRIKIRTVAVVKSLEAQIEFVKAGVGMALMPSGIERFCTDRSIAFYSFADLLPKREVVVMWRKDRKLSKVAEELKAVIHSIAW